MNELLSPDQLQRLVPNLRIPLEQQVKLEAFQDFACKLNATHEKTNYICIENKCPGFLSLMCAACEGIKPPARRHLQSHLVTVRNFISQLTERCEDQLLGKQTFCEELVEQLGQLSQAFLNLQRQTAEIARNIQVRLQALIEDATKLRSPAEDLKSYLLSEQFERITDAERLREFLAMLREQYLDFSHEDGSAKFFVREQRYTFDIRLTATKFAKRLSHKREHVERLLRELQTESARLDKSLNELEFSTLMVRSAYQDSQQVKEFVKGKVFQGTNERQQFVYSHDAIERGRKDLEVHVEKFGSGKHHLFLGVIEDGYELTDWPTGERGCKMCVFTNFMHQMGWENEGQSNRITPKVVNDIREGDVIKMTLDMDLHTLTVPPKPLSIS